MAPSFRCTHGLDVAVAKGRSKAFPACRGSFVTLAFLKRTAWNRRMEQSKRPSAGIITLVVGGVIALLLLGWFVAVDSRSISGDAVVGQAFEALTALGLLWLVLFVLVIVDRLLG